MSKETIVVDVNDQRNVLSVVGDEIGDCQGMVVALGTEKLTAVVTPSKIICSTCKSSLYCRGVENLI